VNKGKKKGPEAATAPDPLLAQAAIGGKSRYGRVPQVRL